MSMFQSRQQSELATVTKRLTAAEAALPPLRQKVAEASLAAALSDDMRGAMAATAALADAEMRVTVLRQALQHAQQAEQDRLAEVRAKSRRSELHAFQQRISRVEKAVADYDKSITVMHGAWETLLAEAASCRALLGQHLDDYPELFERSLQRIGEHAMARVGRRGFTYGLPGPSMPGSTEAAIAHLPPEGRPQDVPLAVPTFAAVKARYLAQFRKTLGLEIPPAVAEPIGENRQKASAEPHSPGNPHPAGSLDALGFEYELARLRGEAIAEAEPTDPIADAAEPTPAADPDAAEPLAGNALDAAIADEMENADG